MVQKNGVSGRILSIQSRGTPNEFSENFRSIMIFDEFLLFLMAMKIPKVIPIGYISAEFQKEST